MSRLIYSCVFFNESYLDLLNLLLESFSRQDTSKTKYLIITTSRFQHKIQEMFDAHNIDGDIWCINSIFTQFAASCARLQIFSYPEIAKYDTLLYLDTDILITKSLEPIFDIELEEKLYSMSLPDVTIGDWGNGKDLFAENDVNIDPRTPQPIHPCVLLFKNCEQIKCLFFDILTHIEERVPGDYDLKGSFDQDFIIYHCFMQNCFNNTHLNKFVKENHLEEDETMILNHFCALHQETCATPFGKQDKMITYLSKIGTPGYTRNIIHVGANIGDCFNELEIISLFDYVSINDTCVFVEPIPYLFKQLEENYNTKYPGNKFIFINKAVSNHTGEVEMTMVSESTDFTKEEFRYYPAMSSIDPDFIAKHQAEGNVDNAFMEKITVPAITLTDIVQQSGMTFIDLLQVDAEGHDFEILYAYDFSVIPKKIIFEHCHMKDGNLAILLSSLQMMGYKQIGFTELDIVLELSK